MGPEWEPEWNYGSGETAGLAVVPQLSLDSALNVPLGHLGDASRPDVKGVREFLRVAESPPRLSEGYNARAVFERGGTCMIWQGRRGAPVTTLRIFDTLLYTHTHKHALTPSMSLQLGGSVQLGGWCECTCGLRFHFTFCTQHML